MNETSACGLQTRTTYLQIYTTRKIYLKTYTTMTACSQITQNMATLILLRVAKYLVIILLYHYKFFERSEKNLNFTLVCNLLT